MLDRSHDGTSTALLRATSTSDRTLPDWSTEALVHLRFWKTAGWLDAVWALRWDRPAKTYELVDLVLVLLLAMISGARSLRALYRDLPHDTDLFAAAWGRKSPLSRAQTSALLRTIPADVAAAFSPF